MRRRPGSQWTPGVTERSDMRDQLIAHVIGDGRGTRRSCPGYLVTCWRGVNHHVAGRPGGQRHDRPYPGGLSWSTRIPVQRPAIPRARRHRSRQPPRAGQHLPPVHHRAQQPRLRRRLRRIADRAVACCGAGLRRERVHTQGQKVQPCADSARQCRRAHCPHRYSSPTRSTRYAAPVAGPHGSHVSFISRHLPVRRAQVLGPLHRIDCSPAHICCPGSAAWRPWAPLPGPELHQG